MIVGDLLRRGSKLYPRRVAMHCHGKDLTYAELNQRVSRLANSMLELGLRKSDRIAILAQNCTPYLEVCLASAKIGVVTIPLNARLKESELKYIIDDGRTKILFVSPDFLEPTASVRDESSTIEHCICIGQDSPGTKDYETMLAEASPEEPVSQVTESDVICQIYTSGTTGRPKGAMLTHRNVLSNAMCCCLEQEIQPLDNILMALPLFHVAGYTLSMGALLAGGKLTIHQSFNPQEVLRSMAEDRITHAPLVPVMINFLLSVPDVGGYDFTSLKYIVYGASPITSGLMSKAIGAFKCGFIQGYGLTEAAAFVSLLRADDHVVEGTPEQIKRLTSIGKEILGTEVKVADEYGREVQPGELGEILARGDNIMQGYWKLPHETEQTLRDGWLHTGDMATVDEDGYIYILERKKDMIISGGENIYPREIESVLVEHPAITDAAVIGVPDDVWGEAVKAVVVIKEGEKATEVEIIQFCASRLAGYKKPKTVEFTAELPRNPMGKVLKRVLRRPYWEGYDRGVH